MKNIKMNTMKTLFIVAAILGLQFNTIYAAVNFGTSPDLSNEVAVANALLIPGTPAQATFDDVAETGLQINLAALSPVTPMDADFNDGAPSTEISLINLAPVTPKEADFEDESCTISASYIQGLAPVTPTDADFEDHV